MDRYDVVLQAVIDGVDRHEAVHAASAVLQISRPGLERATEILPAKVLDDVDERNAERLLEPLQRAGWRVRLIKRPPVRRVPPSAHPGPSEPAQLASTPAITPELSWPAEGSFGAPGELETARASLPLLELELDLPVRPAWPSSPPPSQPAELELDPRPAPERAGTALRSTHPQPAEPLADEPPEGETLVEFFASLPRTLLVPVRGGATRWLLRSVVLSLGILVLSLVAVGSSMLGSIVVLGVMFLLALGLSAFWIGHLFTYFRACLWAVIGGDEGPDPPGSLDGDDLYARLFDGSVVIFAFVVVNVAVMLTGGGLASIDALGNRFTIANALLGMHVPIGLALMAVRQTRGSYFDLVTAVKLLLTAPVHLLVVLTLAFALSQLTTLALKAMVGGLGASVAAGNVSVLWVGVPGMLLASLALTLLQWGVLGAVMGAVCRARPGLVA